MSEADLLDEIRGDVREAPDESVIYLEGKTDPDFLFALLGLPSPSDGLHQGVLVRGLKGGKQGSGSNAVTTRVALAGRHHIPRILGVIDGDGMGLNELGLHFDHPHPGPLFRWKAYCIENLLAKTGWPAAWGDGLDWPMELMKYGPYAALNRVGLEARTILKDLELERYARPVLGDPPRASGSIAAALATGKARLLSFDVERRFLDELAAFEESVRRSLDEAHSLLNGKWLIRHMAPTLTGRDPDRCQFEWIAHARTAGGLSEVREWWERVTGSPP